MPSSDGPKRFLFGGLPTSGAVTAWLGMFLGGLHEDEVSALAETVAPDIAGPLFIPTLRLASAPEPDALARGAFLGIGTSTTAAQLARAVLEGLAMEAARILDLMSAAAPSATVGRIVAVGGGTRNRLLMRLKANCFGRTVEIPGADETSALGAAVCAAVAAGTHPDMAAAMAAMCARPGRQIEPQPELSGFYRHRMENLHTPLTRVLVQDVNPVLPDPVPSGSDRA